VKGGRVRFYTKVLQTGKTATGIHIPNEVVKRLGTSKRPPVRITIIGQTYRSTVAVMGGKFMAGVREKGPREDLSFRSRDLRKMIALAREVVKVDES
jgi:hypothetical protein